MKQFYALPKPVQWIIAIVLFVGGFGMMMPILMQPYGLLTIPLMAPFLNVVSVPFFRLIGCYKYLNPSLARVSNACAF